MLLPTSPSRSARMMGMPPQTLASNPSRTLRVSAAFIKPNPSSARSALFAVTTCFRQASDCWIKLRAGSIPPTSSTTMSQPFSITFSGRVVKRERSTPGRSFCKSRTRILVIVNSAPVRCLINEELRLTSSTRPRPTVPQPRSPIFSFLLLIENSKGAVLANLLCHSFRFGQFPGFSCCFFGPARESREVHDFLHHIRLLVCRDVREHRQRYDLSRDFLDHREVASVVVQRTVSLLQVQGNRIVDSRADARGFEV